MSKNTWSVISLGKHTPTFVFWICRLPCSSKEKRASWPSRFAPFFLQVTVGSGSPDAWHLRMDTPPRACVWLDGPCRMMGGGRPLEAKNKRQMPSSIEHSLITLIRISRNSQQLSFLTSFYSSGKGSWPSQKVLICSCHNNIRGGTSNMLASSLMDMLWVEVTVLQRLYASGWHTHDTASHTFEL